MTATEGVEAAGEAAVVGTVGDPEPIERGTTARGPSSHSPRR
jgi:hypothetical protein